MVGWAVPDLDSALRHLGESGVEPNSYPGMTGDDGTWTAPGGDRIAWLTDPDGNVLSLTQFVADHAQAREIAPIFPTRDLAAAIERYARLGFTTSSFDVDGTAVYGFLERNGVHVHLAPFDELDPASTTSAAYLYVDDADALSAEWGAAGVEGRFHPRGRHRLRTARGRLRRSRRQPRPLRLLRLTAHRDVTLVSEANDVDGRQVGADRLPSLATVAGGPERAGGAPHRQLLTGAIDVEGVPYTRS